MRTRFAARWLASDRDDPKTRLLEDTWLLTIFAVLLAVALPWFVSALDIEFGAASAGIFVLGLIYLSLAAFAARARALAALHAVGVLVMGTVWHYGGGLQNPAFLLAFALPVIGASFISRWQPYSAAALAVLVVAAVALVQAPELRWYASGLGAAGPWLAASFAWEGLAAAAPFPGFSAPSAYAVVLLEVFAILSLACAVTAEYLGTVFARLHAHVAVAQDEAERAHHLWTTLIEHMPVPALLVEAGTLRVICASERVAPELCTDGEAPAGRNLLETLRFSHPEIVEELVTGQGGSTAPMMIRVGDRLRVTEVRVRRLAHKERSLALVLIDDRTEPFCVKAALDTADHAALIVDSKGCIAGFNKQVLVLFPKARIGEDATILLSPSGSGVRWWEAGLTARRKMHVEILQRLYQVTRSTVPLPGEEESMYVIAFLPVAKVDAATLAATGSTRLQLPGSTAAMRVLAVASLLWLGGMFAPTLIAGETSQANDRLIVTANGSTLTGASGGGGGAVSWLHDVRAGTLFGAGLEYQTIAGANWTVGSLRGAFTRGEAASRTTVHGEIHGGSGRIDARSFDYSVAVAGVNRALPRGFTLALETRQIDIDSTHGNLPKLSVAYLWSPRLVTEVSYADSIGGNLATELLSARLDYYAGTTHWLFGGGVGDAAPAVVNLQNVLTLQRPRIKQVFFGLSRPLSYAEVMVVGDYLDIGGSERATLTLSCTLPLDARTAKP